MWCTPTGMVRFSVSSNVLWSSLFPCDEASVPATMAKVLGVPFAVVKPRTVICGNVTGTVRKSWMLVRFNNISLKTPFGRLVRISATDEWVFELNRYAFEVRPKSGLEEVDELRLKVVLSAAA